MNENRIKRNQLLGGRIVQGLKSRNMDGYYAETKEDALKKALEWIGRKHGRLGRLHVDCRDRA